MPTLIDQPVSIPTSTRTASVVLPDSYTSFDVRLSRNTTATPTFWANAATTIDVNIYLSLDGGLNFPFFKGFQAQGGIVTGKGGFEYPYSGIADRLPAGTNRRAQVEVVVNNGPLVSNLFVAAQ